MFRIELSYVAEEIERRIDAALHGRPCSPEERRVIHAALYDYVEQHGQLPESFELQEKTATPPVVAGQT